MTLAWPPRIALSVSAAVFLCGCPNPNAYTTPRTLDRGKVQWQVAPEFIGVSYSAPTATFNNNGTVTTNQQTQTAVAPMIPTFGARIGLADGFELGLRVANLDSLGVDGKIRLLKGRFDMALDPGIQGYDVTVNGSSLGVAYFHLPILLGLNLSKDVTLVLKPGVVYAIASASTTGSSGIVGVSTSTGLFGELGFGVDFRVSKTIAIHPELTAMRQLTDSDALIYVGGIGFNIGAQPDYSDLDEAAAP